jgi:hypothetical protein
MFPNFRTENPKASFLNQHMQRTSWQVKCFMLAGEFNVVGQAVIKCYSIQTSYHVQCICRMCTKWMTPVVVNPTSLSVCYKWTTEQILIKLDTHSIYYKMPQDINKINSHVHDKKQFTVTTVYASLILHTTVWPKWIKDHAGCCLGGKAWGK